MRHIFLTRGQVAVVSNCDYSTLKQWKWRYDGKYARTTFNKRTIFMHWLVGFRMGLSTAGEIDHKNRQKLDNRRSNLRNATCREQRGNQGPLRSNTSGCRGVYWHQGAKKWIAYIRNNGKREYLGLHLTREEAARAYNKRAKQVFKEFAWLNPIKHRTRKIAAA